MNRTTFAFIIAFLMAAGSAYPQKGEKLTKNVDPFIGTGGHGHTFPGATVPFGMVQLSPDTYNRGWDWCSGYHVSDSSVMGFSHTHLSGTGATDYGDILFMPTLGELKIIPGTRENPDEGYRSRFKHANEKASPGYYSVLLDDYKILVELTTTTRVGFHKYTFQKAGDANVVIDLHHGISDRPTGGDFKVVNNTEIEGYRKSAGWNANHTVYFVAKFSKPFKSFGVAEDGAVKNGQKTGTGSNLQGFVQYAVKKNETVLVKVGISHVSIENARKNLEAEVKDWNFDAVKKEAESKWEKELSKIIVEGGSKGQRTTFYTALYHSMIAPNIFDDVDGSYWGMDGKVKKSGKGDTYTVFSLWDTFRGLHPLLSIIDRKRTNDFINTFINKYNEYGLLPVWELAGWETNCMIGYHSIPVIVDAYMKGIRDYDIESVFAAMKVSAEQGDFGIEDYRKYGYLPADKSGQSVSRTLEYAYDDWCIAVMAEALNKKADYDEFAKRSLYYANLFDGQTGFMVGKLSNGSFKGEFNPFEVSGDYTEANAWQYNLFVPHDVKGLMNLFGGKEKFTERLDELFVVESKTEGDAPPDITGLVGQYAHGNEPSHHMAYLYNYIGEGYKTQSMIRKIMSELYSANPDGLSGNEDCGQMSAWYVLSAMGFYPVAPGTNEYVIGSPIFTKVTINLENGKKFVINAPNSSDKNMYIQSVKKNGQEYNPAYFVHDDIINGAEFTFAMGSEPNKNWAVQVNDYPYSFTTTEQVSTPYLTMGDMMFLDSTSFAFDCRTAGVEIRYTIDGSEPTESSPVFGKTLAVKETATIKAKAFKAGYAPSPVYSFTATKAVLLEPAVTGGANPGLNYEYFEGRFRSAYDLMKSTAKKSGNCEDVNLSMKEVDDFFGVKFLGYIDVPQDGIYKFTLASDDGSVLLIDDIETVNSDGYHGANPTSDYVGLKAGKHFFTLLYFEGAVTEEVRVGIQGPGIKAENIPASMLYRIK